MIYDGVDVGKDYRLYYSFYGNPVISPRCLNYNEAYQYALRLIGITEVTQLALFDEGVFITIWKE